MFNKKELKDLWKQVGEDRRKIDIINDDLYGRFDYSCFTHGLKEKVTILERENAKLKAIVGELCDYVYRNNE